MNSGFSHDFRTMTEATKITMWLADRAVRASGILESDIRASESGSSSPRIREKRQELSPIFSQGVCSRHPRDITKTVHSRGPAESIEQAVKSGRMPGRHTLLGRLNCGCGRLHLQPVWFMGPSYSVSAACATSLVALHSAIQMIRNASSMPPSSEGARTISRIYISGISALGALYGLSGRKDPLTRPPAPSMLKETGWSSAKAGG